MESAAPSIDERYTFVKQLGHGGYGTTWMAVDNVTGKTLVLKEISKAKTSRSDFKRELHYSKSLSKHPNIITTHNAAHETKTSYVSVQDCASGGDLFDVIEPEMGLKESTAKLYLGQICSVQLRTCAARTSSTETSSQRTLCSPMKKDRQLTLE